ncbi:MAG: hypothetical protein F6K21_29205 [Symploca sp. SIO2D2]|nr:hypothetical protein [Symploca sp. SIO2D2]
MSNAGLPENTDILIIGSGPIGATFARRIKENGYGGEVVIVDAGPQRSKEPGQHLKNTYLYQKDRRDFSNVVRAELYPLSIPSANVQIPNLDPIAFWQSASRRNNLNPCQDPNFNMPESMASFAVGGMGLHWTCAIPRFTGLELTKLAELTGIEEADFNEPYTKAEEYFKNQKPSPFSTSERGKAIINHLGGQFGTAENLPVAAQKVGDETDSSQEGNLYIHWTGPSDILGGKVTKENIHENFVVKQIVYDDSSGTNTVLSVKGYRYTDKSGKNGFTITINEGGKVIVAAGAIKTAQLLYHSLKEGTDHTSEYPALGRYLHEHTMAFTQVILSKEIVEELGPEPKAFNSSQTTLPIKIPTYDLDPTLYIKVDADSEADLTKPEKRPWHCQIHKDPFSYGQIGKEIEDRLVVDLRWFGMVETVEDNKVVFNKEYEGDPLLDIHGLPQPTFEFQYIRDSSKDEELQIAQRHHRMMEHMIEVANKLGAILPETPPQFLPAGSSLHTMGTVRMGKKGAIETSVVDPNSKVHNFTNLYLGGPGVIPSMNAVNPTLTAAALAIIAVDNMMGL